MIDIIEYIKILSDFKKYDYKDFIIPFYQTKNDNLLKYIDINIMHKNDIEIGKFSRLLEDLK